MWTKLDDGFPDHPKVTACGPLAAWLYVCGLCYTNRLLTDGFIPSGQIRRLADVPDADALAEKLCEVGLWDHTEGGYTVHDFHDFNMTADELRERRAQISAARSEAGKRGADARWQNGKTDSKSIATGMANANGKTMAPLPTTHIPLDSISSVEEIESTRAQSTQPAPKPQRAKSQKTPLPPSFEISEEMLEWQRDTLPGLRDVYAATEEWLDYCRREGARFIDWKAAWRNGMRKALEFQGNRKAVNGNGHERRPNRNDATNEYLGQLFNAGGNGTGASITPIDRPRLR